MLHYSFKYIQKIQRCLVGVLVFVMLFSSISPQVFAEDAATSTESTTTEPVELVEEEDTENPTEEVVTESASEEETIATSTDTTTEEETGTTTPETTNTEETSTSTATSTDETTNSGPDGTDSPDTDTGTSTATSTEESTDGESGSDGSEGGSGDGTPEDTATTTAPGLESDPIPLIAEGLIGDDDAPEGEDVTGGILRTGRNTLIETGIATAQGEVFTDANSTNVRSELDPVIYRDLDTYTFNATGTNEAVVLNDVAALSSTGDNVAYATGEAEIYTGDAVSAFNIANVINTSIVNSDGYIYLVNQILEDDTSLDLQDFFFPGGSSALAAVNDCNLLSCAAEDIEYSFSQTNAATITNDAIIEVHTGKNFADGDFAQIHTGDAYGAANVMNVVNTNIVDSNYRLMTFNAVGDLEGDLILPTEDLFDTFFGLPNGLNQLEDSEDADINVDNVNDALVNNNLDTYAETGLNESLTTFDSEIVTGRGEAESNVLNKINENVYGGDLMYLLIRVHGYWSGDVVGLPDGLTWEWTPMGIVIYNENAEITPSEMLGYDIDSYDATFTNHNDVVIDNNINIDAITGENEVDGLLGSIHTGNAFASANVMNIANTNVIGANWTMAVVNILGDFDGNVTFVQTDLSLSGEMEGSEDPLTPGSGLLFRYTVANTSDKVASDVVLRQTLQNAHTGGFNQQSVSLGEMLPGETQDVVLTAAVDSSLAYGTSSVTAVATVESAEGDSDESDNSVLHTLSAYVEDPNGSTTTDGGTSTTTDDGTSTTTDDGTGTSTDDGSGTSESGDGGSNTSSSNGSSNTSSGGGGGGGGGSKSKTKSIDREALKNIDPDKAPFILLTKESDVDEDDIITAGQEVDYTITVLNKGGTAYDAVVYDTLRNPINAVLHEQSWELGTILPGEEIVVEYTTLYDALTPSGKYTNTASIEAYRHADTKAEGGKSLKLDEAVHTIEIEGVDLAVGNAGVVAYYPSGNGLVSALVTWETNKPATGQVFYSPQSLGSVYNPSLPNFGYQTASFKFNTPKTKHYMILRNLIPGVTYDYKVRSTRGSSLGLGGNYVMQVPSVVNTLTLSLPNGTTMVAGASISTPSASAPTQPVVPTPAPATVPPLPPTPPAPAPDPEPTPEQSASSGSSSGGGGFMSGVVGKVFGLFR